MDKAQPKPELTDAGRHQRFVQMAREVETSDHPKTFDQAFEGRDWTIRTEAQGPQQ